MPSYCAAMSRARHAKPSKAVRKEDLTKKKTSQLHKIAKPASKNATPKTSSPRNLRQLLQEREVKKKTDPKPPLPARSLLTRAGAARLGLDRTEVLFQNPESLTCNGFTMALRSTSLSRRLSQPPVVKPKKVPPSKSSTKPPECDPKGLCDVDARLPEKESVPNTDPLVPMDTGNLTDTQNASFIKGESQETVQAWSPMVEGSKINVPMPGGPAAEFLSEPLERTSCGEGLFPVQMFSDVSNAAIMFTQDATCAPLPQRATNEVTSEGNPSTQLEGLGPRVESLKLSDSTPDPIQSEQNCLHAAGFNQVTPGLDLGDCLSVYPMTLINLLLAGSELQNLGAQPPPQETLRAALDQGGAPGPDSVLGPALALPPQGEFPGANLVPGKALAEAAGPPAIPSALSVQGEVFGAVPTQQDMEGVGAAAAGLPAGLPVLPDTLATYSALPTWPEPPCPELSYGVDSRGALSALPLGSGHTPQSLPSSESASAPPHLAASNVENEKPVSAGLLPAGTPGVLQGSLGAVQLCQAGVSELGSPQGSVTSAVAGVHTTGVALPVSLASTSSAGTTLLPTLERRKRKRCGVCGPCQLKGNCGECTYCKNRKNSHQICKRRKCEELKKRPSALSAPLEVVKENKRPQREKKPKVLKVDFDKKLVNGLKSESMEYSRGGHGEEQTLELNTHVIENVTKNEESMTGLEVEKWTQNKKSHLTEHVNGDFSTHVTEIEKSKCEDEKKQINPSKLFVPPVRNGIKNVHCLPTEANVSLNKFNVKEFGKALENHKLLKDTANHNNTMSTVASTMSCDHLKGRSNVSVFQKSGFHYRSVDVSPNLSNQMNTHDESPVNIPNKEPKDGSPLQPGLLSLIKDRRLTLEQVVAIEALTQLSEAPSENSSPSKSEKSEDTDERTASLLNSCKAILYSVRKDFQAPTFQGQPQSNHHCPSLEKQHSGNTIMFNGQNTLSKLAFSSDMNQASTKPREHSGDKNLIASFTPKSSPSKVNKSAVEGTTGLDGPKSSHQLSPRSNKSENCNRLPDSGKHWNLKDDPSSQDASYSQIEEDVATQLTQLASIIKCSFVKAKDQEVASPPTPASLETCNVQERHSPDKGLLQQNLPPSTHHNHGFLLPKQKSTAQKKAKSTSKRDRRKKNPTLAIVSCQKNDQKRQEQRSSEYSRLCDLWIASKFQRFGQFSPHDFPVLLGKIPPFSQVLKPLAEASSTLQHKEVFLPLSQIKFKRDPECRQEKMMKVEPMDPLPMFHVKTEPNGQACTDNFHDAQAQSAVNVTQNAYALPPPSSPLHQCANAVTGGAQVPFPQDDQEHLMHQRLPPSSGTAQEAPLSDPEHILRNVQVVSSGGLMVVSCKREEDESSSGGAVSEFSPVDNMQKKFNDHAVKFLPKHEKNLVQTTEESEIQACNCLDRGIQKDKGPYYTHLGAGPSVAAVREIMENRYGQKGEVVRIEKIVYTTKEGKSSLGCPVAKWVVRRSCKEEKVVCLVRERAGHHCQTAVIVVLIMLWDGIPLPMADRLYTELTDSLKSYNGHPTDRRCALNENRTCMCQGVDPETCGASFSFGCSWSMYFNGCKFGRSPRPRRFRIDPSSPLNNYYERVARARNRERKLKNPEQVGPKRMVMEKNLEDNLQSLATELAPIYKQLAPKAYENQVINEHNAPDCRLGRSEGRPFCGVTACLDFCAHAHRDIHNMNNGSTVVCTLTREDNRSLGVIPEDEQLHVLPLYKLADTDEFGSYEGMEAKIKSGAIQVLKPSNQKRKCFTQPIPRSGKKRAAIMTEVLDPKVRAVEKKQVPRVKRKSNSTMAISSKALALPPPGSDPSIPHAVKEASAATAFGPPRCPSSAVRCSKPPDAGPAGRGGAPHCAVLPGRLSGANAVVACNGPGVVALPGAGALLPTLSPPPSESLVRPEPPCGPAELPIAHQPSPQPPVLASPRELPCPAEDKEPHSEVDDPPSEDALSDEAPSPADESPPHILEYWSDHEDNFGDPEAGGVAIAPSHGSVLIECARRELHATTPLNDPDRGRPSRLSLVFYQHKNLNKPQHGFQENKVKFESKEAKNKKNASEPTDQVAHLCPESNDYLSPEGNELNEIPSHKAVTLTHDNVITVSPYALTLVAGPYNHWV